MDYVSIFRFSLNFIKNFILSGSPVVTDDGNYLHLFPQEGTSNSSWFWADIRNEKLDKEIQMIPISENSDAEYFFVANDNDTVYIRTNKGASNYRFVKLNIKNPDEVCQLHDLNK